MESGLKTPAIKYWSKTCINVFCGLSVKRNVFVSKIIPWRMSAISEPVTVRSSLPEVFCKKGVLKNFTEFTRKHLLEKYLSSYNSSLNKKSQTMLK